MKHIIRFYFCFVWLAIMIAGNAASVRADDGFEAARVKLEESLVWRTPVVPLSRQHWHPAGFHFLAAKPTPFFLKETVGLPFLKTWEWPTIVQSEQTGWQTDGPIRMDEPPLDPNQVSDAPQFGVRVLSDHVGLRLFKPTFLFILAGPEQVLQAPSAQMPDAIEFRIERGSGGAAIFSAINRDPQHVVTLHNLRFVTDSPEIPLKQPILLDQTIPLAHPFSDERQATHPPVVLPKESFTSFRKQFPDAVLPVILPRGAESRKFVLSELYLDTWIYIEGFATHTDAEGQPILDARGLPERPSEFRYGFRIASRDPLKLDLVQFDDPELFLDPRSQPRSSSAVYSGSPSAATSSSLGLGTMFSGGNGGNAGGGGFGGGSGGGFGNLITTPPTNYNPGGGTPTTTGSLLPGIHPEPPPVATLATDNPPPSNPGPPPTSLTPEPKTLVGALLAALSVAILARREFRASR